MIANEHTVIVPHDWSDEEALIVVQFLEAVTQSVWNLYGDRVTAAMHRHNAAFGRLEHQSPGFEVDQAGYPAPSALDEE